MTPEQAQAIGAYLRAQRDASGFSQNQLAERSGVERSVIARFETGAIRGHDPDKLARLSRALDVSLNEVLAAGKVTSGADLPRLPVYLRARYDRLPDEAVEQMNRYFDRLARRYGIDPNGPAAGEDETPVTPTRRNRAH